MGHGLCIQYALKKAFWAFQILEIIISLLCFFCSLTMPKRNAEHKLDEAVEKLDMQIETAHDVTGDLRNIMHVAFLLTSVVFAFRTDVFACRLKCTVLQRFARSFWLSPSTPFSNMPKKQSLKRSASPPVDMPQVVHKPPPERGRSALPEITMNPVLEKAMALHQEGKQEVELANSSALPPGPKYRAGQSVFQWWACWMKDAVTPPATYIRNKKIRPKWYSGEVVFHCGWQTKHYAGREFSSNFYRVHDGNSDAEVPEEFILDAAIAREASHSAGRPIEQTPPPEFWESFNTSNVCAQSPPGLKYRAGQSVAPPTRRVEAARDGPKQSQGAAVEPKIVDAEPKPESANSGSAAMTWWYDTQRDRWCVKLPKVARPIGLECFQFTGEVWGMPDYLIPSDLRAGQQESSSSSSSTAARPAMAQH
jgi:hypothetical protein